MALVETNITKIEITTTQAVDVQQLARDIRASIGYCNITMHGVMTNLCDVALLRGHGILSETEIIVHINRAVGETGDPPISEIVCVAETELPSEVPPLKKFRPGETGETVG